MEDLYDELYRLEEELMDRREDSESDTDKEICDICRRISDICDKVA